MPEINPFEHHKGERCWINNRLCQESQCIRCQIYQDYERLNKMVAMGRVETALFVALRSELCRN